MTIGATAAPKLHLVDHQDALDDESATFDGQPADIIVRAILAASQDCVKVLGTDGALQYMNYNGRSLMEVDDFSAVRGQQWSALWPEAARDVVLDSVERARNGEASRFEALCPTGKGTPRWWDVSVSPMFDHEGRVSAILSTSRDITHQIEREQRLRAHELQLQRFADRQAAELDNKTQQIADQDLLLREIDHRVKNSLAMISGLLRLHARTARSEESRADLNDAANRVITVSRIHERLYQASNLRTVALADYLEPLAVEIVDATGSEDAQITVSCAERDVPADQAISIGLVMAELVSNAVRHGLADGAGTIEVVLRVCEPGGMELVVSDSGAGLPEGFDPKESKGLGMRIVQLYGAQLGAQVDHAAREGGGTTFTLRF